MEKLATRNDKKACNEVKTLDSLSEKKVFPKKVNESQHDIYKSDKGMARVRVRRARTEA